jgi:hypothetical protein
MRHPHTLRSQSLGEGPQREATRARRPHSEVVAQLEELEAEMEAGKAELPGYIGKLTEGYEFRCYAFEVFECVRKIALVGIPVFFSPPGSVSQTTFALMTCFITFGVHTTLSPYINAQNDRLSQICQAQTVPP